jgi:hypothetical protein
MKTQHGELVGTGNLIALVTGANKGIGRRSPANSQARRPRADGCAR